MDEPFLPWWLMLLLGMWAVALMVWQHPSVHREIRLWAGLSSLVYLGLIFLALGVGHRTTPNMGSFTPPSTFVNAGLAACVVVTLTACVWLLGRASLRSRQICYVLLTLTNAVACSLMHAQEIAVGLCVVGLISIRPLFEDWRNSSYRSLREWFLEFAKFDGEPSNNIGELWLIGGLNGILACVLIGTLAYSLRIETARAAPSPRYTALPSRVDLDRIHASSKILTSKTSLVDLAFGKRADVVVLMSVIAFLCLAIARNDSPLRLSSPPVSETSDSPERHTEGLV